MRKTTLPLKRTLRFAVMFLALNLMGLTNAFAYIQHSFSAYCPSGQLLYFYIADANNHYVGITHPNPNNGSPWQGFTAPTGQLTLPETVTYQGVTYTVTEIADYTFSNCSGLTGSLVIPNSVTTIMQNAFSYCTGLTGTLTLSNSLTDIPLSAFGNCRFTGSLVIPSSVTAIGKTAFQACRFNGTLTLPEGLTSIEGNAFEGCPFTGSLIIPNSVTNIGNGAFCNCGFNGNLTISNNLIRISSVVFKGCSGFQGDLVIPNGITKINQEAFQGCSGFSAIYVCTENMPTLANGGNMFTGMNRNIPVYVNIDKISDYTASTNTTGGSWHYFNNFQGRSFFIQNGDWSTNANWTSQTVPPTDRHVVIAANCTVDGNYTQPSATILKGYSMTIAPEAKLTANTLTNKGTAANFVIQEGGQLYHNNTGVQATVLKSIEAYTDQNDGWYLISNPLTSNTDMTAIENLLSNNYDLYYYDEPTAYWINQKDENNNFNQLVPGKGYLYANNTNIDLSFAGTLKTATSTMQLPLVYTEESNLAGFNLIGNPYAHDITTYSSVNVAEEGCFRLNGNSSDLMVSEISIDNPLRPAEGFFVQATADNASITFNGTKTRSEIQKNNGIALDVLEGDNVIDRLIIKPNEESCDFVKLSIRDNRTKIYATRDNKELAIVGCNENEQKVNFKTVKNGSYTISVNIMDVETEYLHLIDNLTGNDVDLLATSTYTFEARKTDYASRFRLVFTPDETDPESLESFAFINNGSFIINNDGVATLQVIDMTGRVLSSESINGNFTKPIELSRGVYVLRLINGDNVKSQKMVVQ